MELITKSFGIRCGNGLLVVDADIGHAAGVDGVAALKDLFFHENEDDVLPEPTVKTGGGGYHYYFRTPEGTDTPNNTAGRIAKGVDTRGDGGQVVAPPSPHQSGTRYEWVAGLPPPVAELPLAPMWLISIIKGITSNEHERKFKWGTKDLGANRQIKISLGEIANASEGTRHDTLISKAGYIYGYVKADRADYELVTEAIYDAYRRCDPSEDAKKSRA